jgi:hydrogenase expression/formation protein HypD
MKYIDGFRDPDAAAYLTRRLQAAAARMSRPMHLMEVCGTHTMAIARSGLRQLMPPSIELLSGPGCPVCVTPAGYLNAALALARQGFIIATFGDMVRVPAASGSLEAARAAGAAVEVCYSPENALHLARAHPDRQVVFLAVGFETTIAPIITTILSARQNGIENYSLLCAFKRIPPALSALVADPEVSIDAFICPPHVSAIIGSQAFQPFVADGLPCVVAGFEPLDILYAVTTLAELLQAGRSELINQYERVVRPGGNKRALALFERLLTPIDAEWRGLGAIPDSGYGLVRDAARYDAGERFGLTVGPGLDPSGCRCGDVLKGKLRPDRCPLFGRVCTPIEPAGPCMVSSEGTCSAYFKYVQ